MDFDETAIKQQMSFDQEKNQVDYIFQQLHLRNKMKYWRLLVYTTRKT